MIANSDIIMKLRRGELDCNNQELFFSHIIKGLLLRLDDDISVRGESIPHFILHTGDDNMYLLKKGHNMAIEPYEISNENYIYNSVPRCIVNPSNIDILSDQLTNPYSRGVFQFESEDNIYTLSAEFRRMPIKLNCELKYYVDSFKDYLDLIQQIMSKLCFIRTYKIVYMGQNITCSYKIPESLQEEHNMELDGTMTDSKYKTITLSLEIETNFPIFEPRTIVSTTDYISKISRKDIDINNGEYNRNSSARFGLYKKDDISQGNPPTDKINSYIHGIDASDT